MAAQPDFEFETGDYDPAPAERADDFARGFSGQLALFREGLQLDHPDDDSESVGDPNIVDFIVQHHLRELHGTDRYVAHNEKIQEYYDEYLDDAEEGSSVTRDIDAMTIAMHDFVEHCILYPEKTAAKLGLEPERAYDIKQDALATLNELFNEVGDTDGLIKAYLFAIDTSRWEAAARVWRKGATTKIEEMVANGEMDARSGAIVDATVNKTALPDDVSPGELEAVLKEHCLVDLKLDAINQSTLNHNIKGLPFKALETLVNIKDTPPKDNPGSTYRDCTEAINFFVPALAALGYKKLAAELRGAALEWLFDDPQGYAERQYHLSKEHFSNIGETVNTLRQQEFSGVDMYTESRVKTIGSLREKLASEDYQGLRAVPDGVGFAFIVPDDMAGAEMSLFAQSYMNKLTAGSDGKIVPGHPKGEAALDDMQGEKRRKSGYEAVHMTFYYSPSGESPEYVPFEIQVLTQQQARMKMYGRSSDLFYKAGSSYSAEDQPYLDHLARRAQAEREMAPGSTIQSIAEMVALSPEIPSVFNKLFRAVDAADGSRLLVPIKLKGLVSEVFGKNQGNSEDAPENLVVLPATHVSEPQFLEALDMFSRDLSEDQNILNALKILKASGANTFRDDGKTSVLTGHILPTALAAVMLAIQSGEVWDSKDFGPAQHMSNITTIALLHDHIETILEGIEDPNLRTQRRQELLYEMKNRFNNPAIMTGLDAMTLPLEIEDEHQRREQYRQNVQANDYAKIIKPADRWQNHITDLLKLVQDKAPKDSDAYQKIMRYFAKTDRHQSADFTSKTLPDIYPRVHTVVWQLAKRFGYAPEPDSSRAS